MIMIMTLFGPTAVLPFAASAAQGDAALFEITGSAGPYERTQVPVRLPVPAGQASGEKPAPVTLTAPGGESNPGQWTGPGLLAGGGSEIHFILPHLKAGESVRLKV